MSHNQIQHDPNFKIEPRYVLFKIEDIFKYLSKAQQEQLKKIAVKVAADRMLEGKSELAAVVVESDWSEYQQTCDMLEARSKGQPNELQRCYSEIDYLTNMHLNAREEWLKQITNLEERIVNGGIGC